MKCPACSHEQPMSFRCKSCGHEFMRQQAAPRPPGAPPPRRFPPPPPSAPPPLPEAPAENAVPALNPYAAPGARSDRYAVSSSLQANEAPLAGRGARLAAQLLDGLFAMGCLFPGMILVIVGAGDGQTRGNEPLSMLGLLLVLAGGIGLLIYQLRLLASEAQTWGKKKMNVRIVMYETGEQATLGRILGLRIIVNGLIGAIPCVGSIYGLVDILFIFGEERRCVHDYLAGTKVVEAL